MRLFNKSKAFIFLLSIVTSKEWKLQLLIRAISLLFHHVHGFSQKHPFECVFN